MVFFTCNNCGESLKKNAAQNHSLRCRTAQGLSCMDCHKVFGDDFVNHLSCVTEQEKYGGRDYVAKEGKNKKKQEEWIEKVVEAWKNDASTKPHFSRHMNDLNKLQNIPRNIKKLKNYLGNCLRINNVIAGKFTEVASRVLESLKEERIQQQNNSVTNQSESKRKITDDDESLPSKKLCVEKVGAKLSEINKEETPNNVEVSLEKGSTKKNKKKVVANGNTQENGDFESNMNKENNNNNVDENGESSKFKWKSSIKNTLRAHNSKMKLKKLQKIIVNQYLSYVGNEDCAEEAKELFQKKINNKKFIIEDKYIQLK